MTLAPKTARLTVLLDPSRKVAFERACREEDTTPSQVLRHLIRGYVDAQEAKASLRAPASKRAIAPRLKA